MCVREYMSHVCKYPEKVKKKRGGGFQCSKVGVADSYKLPNVGA